MVSMPSRSLLFGMIFAFRLGVFFDPQSGGHREALQPFFPEMFGGRFVLLL